jgi:hypothetical protein
MFTKQRLLSAPCGHERYRLELQGELRLSWLAGRALRIGLETVEEAENVQRTQLQLAMDTADGPVEDVVALPVGPGDCWSVLEQLHPMPTVEFYTRVLAPVLQRWCDREAVWASAVEDGALRRPRPRRAKKNPASGGVGEIRAVC